MHPPESAEALAKRLVTQNAVETRELYGPPDARVLQFPITAVERVTVDLGIQPLYRLRDRAQRAARKRPRVSEESPENTGKRSDGTKESERVGTRNDGSGALKLANWNKETGKEGGGGLDTSEERGGGADGIKVAKVHGGAQAKCVSLALVESVGAPPREGALAIRSISEALAKERPEWHPPWKMFRGISGHLGWVRSVAVDHSNAWFATGSADRTVKIWDLATGRLKLTLTGHISTVRGIAISSRHPYMFTVGEDKTVKCWDLEQNKVIRNYHGHLSGVYCVSLHPTLDVLMTGGRDSTVRVWDVRTRAQVFVLGGHRDTVNAVVTQAVDPQVLSASVDSTVRMWDLAAGKCSATLTNHKKGVRALVRHPREFSFASASADNIKTWALPNGTFMRNLSGQHRAKLVNTLAVNDDGVLVSGGDDGSVGFWDYGAAHCFQNEQTVVQPGSLHCEAGIFALAFDHSGSRLISCEADKTIKMWKEDEEATTETHPLNWKPDLRPKRY